MVASSTWTSESTVVNVAYQDTHNSAGFIEGIVQWSPPTDAIVAGETIQRYTAYLAHDEQGSYGAQLWDKQLGSKYLPFGTNHLTIWRTSDNNRLYNAQYPASWILVHAWHPTLGEQPIEFSAKLALYDASPNVPSSGLLNSVTFTDEYGGSGQVGGTVQWQLTPQVDMAYTTHFAVYLAADAQGTGEVPVQDVQRGTNELVIPGGTDAAGKSYVLVYAKNPNGLSASAQSVQFQDLVRALPSTTTAGASGGGGAAGPGITTGQAGPEVTTTTPLVLTTTEPSSATRITGLSFTDTNDNAFQIGGSIVSWVPPSNISQIERYYVYIAYDPVGTAKALLWNLRPDTGELEKHVSVGTNQLRILDSTTRRTMDNNLPANWLLVFTWTTLGSLQAVEDAAKARLYDLANSVPPKVDLDIVDTGVVRDASWDISGTLLWGPAHGADLGFTTHFSVYLAHDMSGMGEVLLQTLPVTTTELTLAPGLGCGMGGLLGIYARNPMGRASSAEWIALDACVTTTMTTSTTTTVTTSTATTSTTSTTTRTTTTTTSTTRTETTLTSTTSTRTTSTITITETTTTTSTMTTLTLTVTTSSTTTLTTTTTITVSTTTLTTLTATTQTTTTTLTTTATTTVSTTTLTTLTATTTTSTTQTTTTTLTATATTTVSTTTLTTKTITTTTSTTQTTSTTFTTTRTTTVTTSTATTSTETTTTMTTTTTTTATTTLTTTRTTTLTTRTLTTTTMTTTSSTTSTTSTTMTTTTTSTSTLTTTTTSTSTYTTLTTTTSTTTSTTTTMTTTTISSTTTTTTTNTATTTNTTTATTTSTTTTSITSTATSTNTTTLTTTTTSTSSTYTVTETATTTTSTTSTVTSTTSATTTATPTTSTTTTATPTTSATTTATPTTSTTTTATPTTSATTTATPTTSATSTATPTTSATTTATPTTSATSTATPTTSATTTTTPTTSTATATSTTPTTMTASAGKTTVDPIASGPVVTNRPTAGPTTTAIATVDSTTTASRPRASPPTTTRLPAVRATTTTRGPAATTPRTTRLPAVRATTTTRGPVATTPRTTHLPVVRATTTTRGPAATTPRTTRLPVVRATTTTRGPVATTPRTTRLPAVRATTTTRGPVATTPRTTRLPAVWATTTTRGPVATTLRTTRLPTVRTTTTTHGLVATAPPTTGLPAVRATTTTRGPVVTTPATTRLPEVGATTTALGSASSTMATRLRTIVSTTMASGPSASGTTTTDWSTVDPTMPTSSTTVARLPAVGSSTTSESTTKTSAAGNATLLTAETTMTSTVASGPGARSPPTTHAPTPVSTTASSGLSASGSIATSTPALASTTTVSGSSAGNTTADATTTAGAIPGSSSRSAGGAPCGVFSPGCHEHMADGQSCAPNCTGDLVPLNNLTCTYDLQGVGHLPGLEGNCAAADQLQSAQTETFVWGILRMWVETYGRNVTEGDFRRALAAALLVGEPAVQRATAAELQRLALQRLLAAEGGPGAAAEARGPARQRWPRAFNSTYVDARLFGLEYVLLPLTGGPSVQELKIRAEAIPNFGTSEQNLFKESLNLTSRVDIITFQDLRPPLVVSQFTIVPLTTIAGPPSPLGGSSSQVHLMASVGVASGIVLLGACCGLMVARRWCEGRKRQEAMQQLAAKKKGFGPVLPTLEDSPEAMDLYLSSGGRSGEVYPEPAPEPEHPQTPRMGVDSGVDGVEIHPSPEPVPYLGDLATAGPRSKLGVGHRAPQDALSRGIVGPAEVQAFLWHHDGPGQTTKVMGTWDSPKPHAMGIFEAEVLEASGEMTPEDVPISLNASPEPRCVMQPPPGPAPPAHVCSDELEGLDLQLDEFDEDVTDFPQPRESPLQEEVAESLRFVCASRGSSLVSRGQGGGGHLEVPDEGFDQTAQGEAPNVHRSALPSCEPVVPSESAPEPSEGRAVDGPGVHGPIDCFSVFQDGFEDDDGSSDSDEPFSL